MSADAACTCGRPATATVVIPDPDGVLLHPACEPCADALEAPPLSERDGGMSEREVRDSLIERERLLDLARDAVRASMEYTDYDPGDEDEGPDGGEDEEDEVLAETWGQPEYVPMPTPQGRPGIPKWPHNQRLVWPEIPPEFWRDSGPDLARHSPELRAPARRDGLPPAVPDARLVPVTWLRSAGLITREVEALDRQLRLPVPREAHPMIALGYIRRSKESGARTVSLEDQRARVADYCQAQGWTLVEVLADDGVSGGRRERLDRLADRVKVTGARAIVVYHLDRFARDLAATLDYLRRFARRGVELHVVGRGRIEADSASGFIVTAVEGLAAEHYRRVISEKTRDALARLRAKGRRVSRWAPYGWRFGPEGRLVADRREAAAVARIGELATAGLSLRGISRVLATEGILARNGRPLAPMTLSRLITRRPPCSPPKISEVGA